MTEEKMMLQLKKKKGKFATKYGYELWQDHSEIVIGLTSIMMLRKCKVQCDHGVELQAERGIGGILIPEHYLKSCKDFC